MGFVSEWIRGLVLSAPESRVASSKALLPPHWGGDTVRASELRLEPRVAMATRLLYLAERICGFQRPAGTKFAWVIGSGVHSILRFPGWRHEVELRGVIDGVKVVGHADAVWDGGEVVLGGVKMDMPPCLLEFKYSRYARESHYPNDALQANTYRLLLQEREKRVYRAYVVYVSSDGVFDFDVTEDEGVVKRNVRLWWNGLVAQDLESSIVTALQFCRENMAMWPQYLIGEYSKVDNFLSSCLRDISLFREKALDIVAEEEAIPLISESMEPEL